MPQPLPKVTRLHPPPPHLGEAGKAFWIATIRDYQVETGPLPDIFEHPKHPYTQALLAALPENNGERALQGPSRMEPLLSTDI